MRALMEWKITNAKTNMNPKPTIINSPKLSKNQSLLYRYSINKMAEKNRNRYINTLLTTR